MLKIARILFIVILPLPAFAWIDPAYQPADPILSLHYSQAQINFERAPPSFITACAAQPSPYEAAWIFAQTARPEGTYFLTTGLYWVDQDSPEGGPHKPILEEDGNGGIDLIHPNGVCEAKWDPDNAFNNFFPDTPNEKPTLAEASIIHDLATDLIRRAERAYGGKQPFLQALGATHTADSQQDPLMQPLLAELRRAN